MTHYNESSSTAEKEHLLKKASFLTLIYVLFKLKKNIIIL